MASKPKKKQSVVVPPTDIATEIKYCNQVLIRLTLEEGLLSIQSGKNVIAHYALSHGHMKRLRDKLDDVIRAYEKEKGKIDTHEHKK